MTQRLSFKIFLGPEKSWILINMTPKLALFLLLIAPLTTLATPKNESMTDIPTGNPRLLWYKGEKETVIEAFKNESEDVSLRKKWLYFNSESTENLMGTFVQKLDTSYTVTEGEDLKLHCKVGKPYPTDFSLSWVYKKNLEDIAVPIESLVNASSSEEPHLKILSKDGVPNAVLKIEDAVYEDRAYYYCIVDRIVAEVIVLCLVILICDKRAAKKEDVDDDDVGNSGGAGNAGGDGSGLRQRK
ncbi:unnamed protein product [Lepeophtheirus salmonis]|uniref:(salmon louse) hypothetical protein n=1 Tax=Lepeophtheirus salmonis TaxID=72036 RepID=A0A7R8CZ12_LEPSM|nr:unnamed protein product [Lepeophtheirus salmonis]CAF2972120.1 unnamed protein product [Lepeophtheirus salmonis]